MFSLTASDRFYLYPYPTDMRKSFYTLGGIVTNQMEMDVQDGDAFIFINKLCTAMKILHMEYGGLVIYHMKLSSGRFSLPQIDFQEGRTVSHKTLWNDLVLMVQGIDTQNGKYRKRWIPEKKDELIRQLMVDRDRLFRENSRLRTTQNITPEKAQQIHDEQLAEKDTLINKKDALLQKKDVRIAQMEKQVDYLKRQLYGGKAERYINPDPQARQLELFEGIDLLPGEKEAAAKAEKEIRSQKEARTKRMEKAKKTAVRKSLPENLERKIEHVYPQDYNPQEWDLPDEKKPLYTEVLVKEPTKFYVLRTYRHKVIRKSDHLIVTADCPVKPIAKSYASSSLLADLMVDKYVDHIPFYRQHKQFERLGIKIPEPTILGWFQQVSDLLMPLHFRLWELMKKSYYLQCDETTLPVVRNDKHKTVKGYIWLVRDPMSGRQYFYWDKGLQKWRSGTKTLQWVSGCPPNRWL